MSFNKDDYVNPYYSSCWCCLITETKLDRENVVSQAKNEFGLNNILRRNIVV